MEGLPARAALLVDAKRTTLTLSCPAKGGIQYSRFSKNLRTRVTGSSAFADDDREDEPALPNDDDPSLPHPHLRGRRCLSGEGRGLSRRRASRPASLCGGQRADPG